MNARTLALVLGALVAGPLATASAADAKTALEASPEGWVDLFNGKDLAGWKRVPIAPDTKLSDRNPWSVDPDKKLLICDATGNIKEMLLHETERTDGIFHAEWRFKKTDAKLGYNSGLYVRNNLNGTIWHQAQVAHPDKPPLLGDLFGETLVDGRVQRVQVLGKGHTYANPVGEWNTYEITCKGKTITVAVNGHEATVWTNCQVPSGHPGIQAEFYYLELRNLKFKPIK